MRCLHKKRVGSPRRAPNRRRGYSLLELLVYIPIMAMGINICALIFVSSMRLSALGSEGLERITYGGEMTSEFREAVRDADAVVPQYANYRTGPDQVVLRAGAVDGAARYIVLGALRDPIHLTKLVIIDRPGKPEAAAFVTYAMPIDGLKFSYDAESPDQTRLVRMAFATHREKEEPAARQSRTHACAALRGIASAGGR